MDEINAILSLWRSNPGAPGVLATVVHVRGSAYRRPGARMILYEDGTRAGSISGGCLEGDLSRKAWWWTASGRPTVRVYDTTSEDDAVWEFGLGCNGVIEVLLERAETLEARELMGFVTRARQLRDGGVAATVVRCLDDGPVTVGERLLLDSSGKRSGSLSHSSIVSPVMTHVRECLRQRSSSLLHLDEADVFLEWIGPPQRLVVFGAGHDAIPVVKMAAQLGWNVTVADGRPAYARCDRFPQAEKVVVLPASAQLDDIRIDRDTAVVLMTHNFPQDVRLMRQILPARPCYLGLLGPKRRTERLFDELDDDPSSHDLHSPVGLDIGCETPETIALSILAEVQAVLSGRRGGSLRNRVGPIHREVCEIGGRNGDRLVVPESTIAACEISLGVYD